MSPLQPLIFFLLSFSLHALAGNPFHDMPTRSRIYRRRIQQDISRNLTSRGVPQAKTGPMKVLDKYSGKAFFDQWDFFTAPDPTHGNVEYVSKEEAMASGLAYVGNDNVAVMAVDDTSPVSVGGNRKSVRIGSQKSYTGGLFVLDVNAMPSGCATWPAFWTVAGDNWPLGGEIDIVEGVNAQTQNQMTLHTAPGCTLDTSARPLAQNEKAFQGTVLSTACDARIDSNSGCGVIDPDPKSYGSGVQEGGGSVFAMLWDSVGIRVWQFKRSNTPADLTAGAPNPSTWPVPSAFWSSTTCPVNQFFQAQQIIINTSLCGDFAGSAYPSSGCPGTCAERVANPNNFKDAKWMINYVAVYQ